MEAEELTKNNDGLILVVAFNYGARQEIVRAVQRISEEIANGECPPPVSTWMITRFLDAPDIPDPDLDHPDER